MPHFTINIKFSFLPFVLFTVFISAIQSSKAQVIQLDSIVGHPADSGIVTSVSHYFWYGSQQEVTQHNNIISTTNSSIPFASSKYYSAFKFDSAGKLISLRDTMLSSANDTSYIRVFTYDYSNTDTFVINVIAEKTQPGMSPKTQMLTYTSPSLDYEFSRTLDYDTSSNMMVVSGEVSTALNANGDITNRESIYFPPYNNGSPSKIENAYDINGKLTKSTSSSYSNGAWVKVYSSTFNYSGQLLTTSVDSSFVGTPHLESLVEVEYLPSGFQETMYLSPTNPYWKSIYYLDSTVRTDQLAHVRSQYEYIPSSEFGFSSPYFRNTFSGQKANEYKIDAVVKYNYANGSWTYTDSTSYHYSASLTGTLGSDKSQILIFPNPCREILHVSNAKTGSAYQVIDLKGTVLLNGISPVVNYPINVGHLHKGLYFFKSEESTIKFILF